MKAIIFDFDGVMAETEKYHYLAWQQIVKAAGFDLSTEEWMAQSGGTVEISAEMVSKKIGSSRTIKELIDEKKEIFAGIAPTIESMPGLIALIQIIDKLALKKAVASQNGREYVVKMLTNLKIDNSFDHIAIKAEKPKPAPDIFLNTAKAMDIDPGDCLVLEDTETGLTAAKSAGMKCYVIPNEFSQTHDFSGADAVLKSLNNVYPQLIKDRLVQPIHS